MTALITAPGMYPNIQPAEYFAEICPTPAFTNSLGTILTDQCPAKAAWAHPAVNMPKHHLERLVAKYKGTPNYPDKIVADEIKTASWPQRLGSVVHRLSLGKGADYVISPYDEFRSGEAKAWRDAAIAKGIIHLKEKEYQQAMEMARVTEHAIEEAVQGCEYETEVVFAWQETTMLGHVIWARIMVDVWCEELGLALDVKTTADASDDGVDRAMNNYGYARQSTFYRRGIDAVRSTPGQTQFKFLFVENESPHLGRVASISEGYRAGSEAELNIAMDVWGMCLEDNQFPGYAERVVSPKPWRVREWMEAGIEVEEEFA